MTTPPTPPEAGPPSSPPPSPPGWAGQPGAPPPPPSGWPGAPAGPPPPPGGAYFGGGAQPPWPPTGPNLPRRRRALRFLGLSLVIAIVAGVVGIVFAGTMFRDSVVLGRDLVMETGAGESEVAELEPGKYLIVAVGQGITGRSGDRSFTHPRFRITDPTGAERPVRSVNYTSRTTIGSRTIVVINEFTVDEAGSHRLEVADERGADADAIGIAKKKELGTGRIVGAIIGFGLASIAGIAVVIFGIIAILAHRERVPIEPDTPGAGPK